MKTNLEFHHTQCRVWVARKAARWVRLARYRREAEQGKIILLCADCNKREPTWGREYKLTGVHKREEEGLSD